jgi:hypothetical protein
MAIAYVGGATASTGTGTATTLTINYTSTTGNALYLAFLPFLGVANITSITDSASNAWSLGAGGVANTCGSMFLAFTTSVTSTSVTTVTIHATTATNICAVLGEYSGVATQSTNNIGAVVAASPVTTGAITIVANNWLPAAMCCQTLNALPVFTSNVGTLRNQATMTLPAGYGFAGVALVDNTSGTTSVTDTANFTGTYLTALAMSKIIQ